MTQIVLILGANGKIGSHAAEAFWNAGWQVRRYSRETDDITAAAMGADVIVNGLNPPHYHNWSGIIPRITRDVIAVARTSEATVILPGNYLQFRHGRWRDRPCDTAKCHDPQRPHPHRDGAGLPHIGRAHDRSAGGQFHHAGWQWRHHVDADAEAGKQAQSHRAGAA